MGGAGRTEANSSNSTSLSIRCTRVSKGKFRENISYSHWNHLGTLTGRKSVHRVFRKKKTVLQSAKHDISPVTLTYDQLDAQIFNTFITILYMYMFRAISCSSSGGWIVSTQHLVSSLSVSDRSVHRLRKNGLHGTVTYWQWRYQRLHIYNYDVDLLRMSKILLETCRGL